MEERDSVYREDCEQCDWGAELRVSSNLEAYILRTRLLLQAIDANEVRDREDRLSREAPDILSSFSVLNKEDMSHGFP